MQSYAPQGGQIVGILEQMKEDFDKDLADEQAKEKASTLCMHSVCIYWYESCKVGWEGP